MSSREKDGCGCDNKKVLRQVVLICVFLFATALLFDVAMFAVGMKTGSLERWARDQYAGQIVELRSDGFVIQGGEQDGKRSIKVDEQTIVRMGRDTIKVDELVLGRYVIVFGSQGVDGGDIEARMVRVFDGDRQKRFPLF